MVLYCMHVKLGTFSYIFEFHVLIEFLVMSGRNAKHAVAGSGNLEYMGSSGKFQKEKYS